MKFIKIREVISPSRGTELSAGIDFFVPKMTPEYVSCVIKNGYITWGILREVRYFLINPLQRILLPSGIKVKIPSNTSLIAHNKSGISSKTGLSVLANVVDADYQGEIHINVVNLSNDSIQIFENEKIIQFLLIPICFDKIEEKKSEEELYQELTTRGNKGFGSTGN